MEDSEKVIQFKAASVDGPPIVRKQRDYSLPRCSMGLHPTVEMDPETHLIECTVCKATMSAWTYLEAYASHEYHIGWKFKEIQGKLTKRHEELAEVERQITNAKSRLRRID